MNSQVLQIDYSVIIPSYNCGKCLSDSLMSVVNQTIPAREVIVIDDGSTDNTGSIIQPFIDNHGIAYLRQKNQGVSASRNTGINHASSDLLAFLDADDIWHPEKMEKQIPLFRNHNTGVVYSLRHPFDENGPVESYRHVEVFRDNIILHLMEHNFLCTSSVVIRRDCIANAGFFNPCYSQGEDLDLWLRIAAEGYGFDYVDEVLVDYRLGGAASSFENIEKRFYDNKLRLNNFFSTTKYYKIITYRMRRHGWAALWRKYSYWLYGQGRRFEAFRYAVASLVYVPFNKMAQKLLVKAILPRIVVNKFRAQHSITSHPFLSGKRGGRRREKGTFY